MVEAPTKRVCQLEVGDSFRLFAVFVTVTQIKDGRLWYCYIDKNGWSSQKESIGANSQQLVEIPEIEKRDAA